MIRTQIQRNIALASHTSFNGPQSSRTDFEKSFKYVQKIDRVRAKNPAEKCSAQFGNQKPITSIHYGKSETLE